MQGPFEYEKTNFAVMGIEPACLDLMLLNQQAGKHWKNKHKTLRPCPEYYIMKWEN